MKSYQNGPYNPRPFRLHLVSIWLSVMVFICFCVMVFNLLYYRNLHCLGSHLYWTLGVLPVAVFCSWLSEKRTRALVTWKGMEITEEGFTLLGVGGPANNVHMAFSEIRMVQRSVRGLLVLRGPEQPGVVVPAAMGSFEEIAAELISWQARGAALRKETAPAGNKVTIGKPARWKVITVGLGLLCGAGVVIWCMNLLLFGALLLVLFGCMRISRNQHWGGFRNPLMLVLLLAWVLLAVMERVHLLPF